MTTPSRIAFALALISLAASAAIEPISPVDGATFTMLTEQQRKIMAIPSYAERLATLKADHDKPHDDRYYGKDRASKWRISAPLTLRWRTTAGEKGPWKITLEDTVCVPFMKHCPDRAARERLYRARATRAPENVARRFAP